MAGENVVEIHVKSKDDTKGGFKKAEAEAESSAGRIGKIFDKLGTQVGERLKTLGGNLGKGGGIFAAGSSILAMAGPIGAATAAIGAFGAVAIPILKNVYAAHQKLVAAEQQYAKATTKAGRASALKAEQQATAGLTAQQKGLMGTVVGLQAAWGKLQAQMTPVVVTIASLAVKLGTALMPALQALATAGAGVLGPIIEALTRFVQSPFFQQFIAWMQVAADQMGQLLAPSLMQLLKLFMQLFMQVGPSGIQLLQILLPLIIRLAADLVPVIAFVAKLVAAILQWLQRTHLLIPLLAVLAVVILSLEAPVMAVVAAVAILIAIGVELSKNWHKIWHEVAVIFDGARHEIAHILADIRHDIAHWVDDVLHAIMSFGNRLLFAAVSGAAKVRRGFVSEFDQIRHDIAHWIDDVVGFFAGLPGRIMGVIGNIGSGILHSITSGLPGSILGAIGLAHGGIVGAAVGGVHGGLRMVGEHGRELVRLPAGSTVHSNPDTERMMAGGGGGGVMRLEIVGAGDALTRAIAEALRQHARVHYAGSAQRAYGFGSG